MNFIGARLRQARIARGLTATALAGTAKLSPSILSGYEQGKKVPPPETIERLARLLDVPPQIFYKKMPEDGKVNMVFYRSVSSATKGLRDSLNERTAWICEIFDFLEKHFDFSDIKLPQLKLPKDKTAEMVEKAAIATRDLWGLGLDPIPSVADVMEKNGITISKVAFDSDKMDGFSFWHRESFPVVVIAADKSSRSRTRFDLAHELGHLALGHCRGSDPDPKEVKQQEEEANKFASAFLLPQGGIENDFDEVLLDSFRRSILNSLGPLKLKWKVSLAAMLYRARELNKINAQQFQSAYVMLSQRGWRKVEPLEDDLPEEVPQVLRSCVEFLVRDGDYTPGSMLELLGLPPKDAAEICGLPEAYFKDSHDISKNIRNRRRG